MLRFSPVASNNGKSTGIGPSTLSKQQVNNSEPQHVQQVSLLKNQPSAPHSDSKSESTVNVSNLQNDNSTTCRPKPIKMRFVRFQQVPPVTFIFIAHVALFLIFCTFLCLFCLLIFHSVLFSPTTVYSFLTECLPTAQAPRTVRSVRQ